MKVLPRNVDTDAASSDVASSVPQSRALSSVPTPIETHEEDLGDTMSRPVQRATLTQEQSRVATVSVSEPPLLPRDDDVMDAGAFSLATELRTEPIG